MRSVLHFAAVFFLAAGAASAQQQAPEQRADDKQLEKELQEALQKDAAAKPKSAAQQQDAAAATGSTATPSGGQQQSAASRAFQSLNPDISGILDGNGGYERRAVAYRNGDDPDLKSDAKSAGAGFTAQEVEVALSAIVDPYFKGEIYLTIPNLSGLEVEEAFATTTSLPANLQIKAGAFRSAFGRQNGQHLHIQDFTRRPLLNAAFLGVDGLRGPGAQVSWLTPLPVYLVLYAEAFSLPAPDPGAPVQSFGGGKATDLTYLGEAKMFVPLADEWSLYAGLSFATGVSAGLLDPTAPFPAPEIAGRRSELFGADLYLKYKPLNVSQTYSSLAWQTEVIFRRLLSDIADDDQWDGGLYSQLVVQVARRWFLGVRGDLLGIPTSRVMPRVLRGSASVTFQASEFARVRLYGELESVSRLGDAPFVPSVLGGIAPQTSFASYLQIEFSIGAHGAHPF
jgi:hypothetical protein